jgi:aspartate oxidase
LWGREIIRCLLARNRDLGTKFMGGLQAVQLKPLAAGFALLAIAPASRSWLTLFAPAVVLATGGAAALYRRHDNPKGMLGDGYVLALEAGAVLQDMEFVQFYPLALAEPGLPSFLIPPALADLGQVANDRDEDILAKYAITEKPVAERARDRFSIALFREIYRERIAVRLDLRHLSDSDWRADPFTASTRRILGERYGAGQRPVRIAPVAHHVMGGVCIDAAGATTVPGLFAAGEVTGGLHGANRMGGNALSETLVFGRQAGRSAAAWAARNKQPRGTDPHKFFSPLPPPTAPAPANGRLPALRQLLWEEGGIVRHEQGLARVLQHLAQAGAAEDLKTGSALRVAALIVQAALERRESRGAHYREDFPQTDDKHWQGHLRVRQEPDGRLNWHFRPVRSSAHAKPPGRR